ncbi:hypothetical protein BJ166DRAFT_215407 [Pestalotiopsis sp. NC0098]|nr:hypothetical protein BJ166DRAFT_215407 [Pestalotiopsis sp. NC0098]
MTKQMRRQRLVGTKSTVGRLLSFVAGRSRKSQLPKIPCVMLHCQSTDLLALLCCAGHLITSHSAPSLPKSYSAFNSYSLQRKGASSLRQKVVGADRAVARPAFRRPRQGRVSRRDATVHTESSPSRLPHHPWRQTEKYWGCSNKTAENRG